MESEDGLLELGCYPEGLYGLRTDVDGAFDSSEGSEKSSVTKLTVWL